MIDKKLTKQIKIAPNKLLKVHKKFLKKIYEYDNVLICEALQSLAEQGRRCLSEMQGVGNSGQ